MKKVKIGIFHCSKTYNYGSMMLAENNIYYLNKMLKAKNIEPIFLMYDYYPCLKDIERLKEATNCLNIESRKLFNYGKSGIERKTKKIMDLLKFFIGLKKKTSIYKNFVECDFLLFPGGDLVSEYYSHKIVVLWQLLSILLINRLDRLFVISQTIGPFSALNKIIISKIFNQIKFPIYSRDQKNVNYCKKELKLKDIRFAPDIAFLDLAKQKLGKKGKKYITFIVSGYAGKYSNNLENYIDSIEKIISYLRTKLKKEEKLLLLPHVIDYPYGFKQEANNIISDRAMIEKIIKKSNFSNIEWVSSDLLPYQAREYLNQSRFVVSGRMHGCISSLQVGTPVIALSYSVKYKGLMELFGLSEFVVECFNSLSQKIPSIKKKIDLLDEGFSVYSRKINEQIKNMKKLSKKPLEEIAGFIETTEKSK